MSGRDKQVLDKILKEAELIKNLIDGISVAEFVEDERTKRAVCMTLINIGELVKFLSDEIKKEHNTIPWRAISGMRDIAAHKYQTINMEDVWLTVTTDIPKLSKQLMTITD